MNNAVKDRNLLEWAAKAAGYDTSHSWNAKRMKMNPPVIGLCIPTVSTLWDPLGYSGDAFNLAVKLRLTIEHSSPNRTFVVVRTAGSNWMEFREKYVDDDTAATRRAIVRAAAAIGRRALGLGD